MKGKNCPNCAAPYNVNLTKCPYCGTSYFDLTAIDFDSGKPIFLKLKVNGYTVTEKCVPQCGAITIEDDMVGAYGGASFGPLIKFVRNRNAKLNIAFEAVPDENGNLFTVVVNDD